MASSIVINFNNIVETGDNLIIQDVNTPSVEINLLVSTGFILPTGFIDIDIKAFYNYIQNNYNATGRYIVTQDYNLNTITIVDNIGGVSFFTEEANNTSGRLTTVISNVPLSTDINITSIDISENTLNPCNDVDITINTNVQATQITSPVNQTVNTNPFTITTSRDSLNLIDITVTDGFNSDSDSISVPKIESAMFNTEVVSTPSDSTVSFLWIGDVLPSILNLQYSLDDVNYSFSNSFSGLSEGSYTVYIKDGIGCSISFGFSVSAFDPDYYVRESVFKISQQNSLITVKREDINNVNVFKNPTNTLSYEEDGLNNRMFKQLFQVKDGVLTQQFRSSYENTDIKLIDCNGNENIIVPEKKSSNIGITDVRDVTVIEVYYLGNYFTGVKYVSGKTYNPITLDEEDSYYLGSLTPNFMNTKDYIQLEGFGWYEVKDIVFVDGLQVLVLNTTASNFPVEITNQIVKGTTKYNQLNYELYEFSIDCNNLSGDYYLTYNATDSEFQEINEQSEWFNVSESQEETYLLQYYNSENNETNYATGIQNKIRIPYSMELKFIPSDTQDVYLTDTNAVSVESTFRERYKLTTNPIPLGMIKKIGIALTNDRLFLNGMSLIKDSELEIEELSASNDYILTCQFVRSDYAISSISDENSIVLPTGQPLLSNDITGSLLFAN